jgi:hypothetical protein
VGCTFGFELWAWPLEASHYAHMKAPIPLYCIGYVFSAHFFGFSPKVDYSIPRPLELDNHNVNTCLSWFETFFNVL